MTDLHEQCSHDGLDMILSLSHKLYEAQMATFDAADAKAGNVVGYVAIAASIIGMSLLGHSSGPLQGTVDLRLVCGAFAAFTLAVVCAIIVLWPRAVDGPPSAFTAIEYWKENGDYDTVSNIIEGMEEAQATVARVTADKMKWLTVAFLCVGLGFLFVAGLAIWRVAGSP